MYAWRRSGTRPLRAPASSTPKQPIMARPAARAMRRAFDSSKSTRSAARLLASRMAPRSPAPRPWQAVSNKGSVGDLCGATSIQTAFRLPRLREDHAHPRSLRGGLGRDQYAFVERGKNVEAANSGEGNERGGIRNDNHKPSRSNVWRSSSRSLTPKWSGTLCRPANSMNCSTGK
jgi:hypothetical protein